MRSRGLPAAIATALLITLAPAGCDNRNDPDAGDHPDAGDGGDGADASTDGGGVTITSSGPFGWYAGAWTEHALTVTGGTPPYTWQLVDRPSEVAWLSLEAATGRLSGAPTGSLDGGTAWVTVRAVDTLSAQGTRSVAIQVLDCTEGRVERCGAYSTPTLQCIEGTRTCVGGRYEACDAGMMPVPSTLMSACGEDCSACDPVVASQCADGVCQCGGLPECAAGATCCGPDGGSPFHCATLGSDPSNCGGCDVHCQQGPGDPDASVPTCAAGSCGFSCVDQASSCDGSCFFRTNMQHCGGCYRVCPQNPPNTVFDTATCATEVCAATCSTGYGDCNSDMAADGCETNVRTSNLHCGQCGNACASNRTCLGGDCCQACADGAAPDGGSFCCGGTVCTTCRQLTPEGFIDVPCCK